MWRSKNYFAVLVCAGAVLAEPVPAEKISTRDIERRQEGTPCPEEYTSKNGMGFEMHCGSFFYVALENKLLVNSIEECMEHCSRFLGWGDGECYGVTLYDNWECMLFNETSYEGDTIRDSIEGSHAALVKRDDIETLDETCPETHLSTHTLDTIEYTVHCDTNVKDNNACWDGYECLEEPYKGFYHATSLDECLGFCLQEHPLCRAAVYIPSSLSGYANCYPKTGFANSLEGNRRAPSMHTVAITAMQPVDGICPDDLNYTPPTSTSHFEIHCNQVNGGTNITSIHRQSITACIDACAANADGCIGVVFDPTLQYGYQNCYLQNTTSVISDHPDTTYALLAGTPLPTSTPSPSSPPEAAISRNPTPTLSPPKKSIIGPVVGGVVGGIAAISLLAFAIIYFRKRRAGPSYKFDAYTPPANTTEWTASTYWANGTPIHEAMQNPVGGIAEVPWSPEAVRKAVARELP